ncbi:MAG: serine/threonine protein kinase [Clostridiales bacterium]|nr:serine/threonine protein kinase [Clostridiales bacterium]
MSFIDEYDRGEWRIESVLGNGAYGKVYKIFKEEAEGIKTYSALKVIPVPQSDSEIRQLMSEGLKGDQIRTYISAMVEDITREAQLIKAFKDTTNIAVYEDFQVIQRPGELGATVLLRMELLDKLEKVFSERKTKESDTIKIGIDITRALEILAQHNIVHRDVKLENIFLSKSGNYKLSDFGIARQIDESSTALSVKGTYSYMAPEVYHRLKYGAAVDIYSLGLVLYRLANNGRAPFLSAVGMLDLSDRENALQKRLSGEPLPPPAEASPELSKIILKACAYDPKDRFSSATEMRNALEKIGMA